MRSPAASARRGRLRARPRAAAGTIGPGLHHLALDSAGDAILFVPARYQPTQSMPLILSLHGAGGNAESGLYPWHGLAEEAGLLLLSPSSGGHTWDAIATGYGPDVALIDHALTATFARCAVDPARLGISGFSDGASYALSLGLTNGDLFPHVLAFSPGFIPPVAPHGAPRLFVSHGVADHVLPIDSCSRRIVPRLEQAGYDVTYIEFPAAHTVPADIARRALHWFFDSDIVANAD